jgi:hypothetical protein
MSEVIHMFAPLRGYEHRSLPSASDSWDPEESAPARYLKALARLGLKDPTKPSATDLYAQAVRLRYHSVNAASEPDEEAAIATALALGEITGTEAKKRLAKAPKPGDADERDDRERRMLYMAMQAAYSAAVRAIHNFDWLPLLRALIEEAVAAGDDRRFDALHDFAALLRSAGLGGLAMVGADPSGTREFEETWRYRTGRPERYHLWRVERAQVAESIFHEAVGPVVFVAAAVVKAPHPTLAEMVAGEMAPGLYAAHEVLAIAGRIVAEQEEARMLAAGEPATSGRGVAVT